MGMLIYIILCGLCLVIEWNAIISMQNDAMKNIQNRTKKNINSIYFSLEIVRSLHCWPFIFEESTSHSLSFAAFIPLLNVEGCLEGWLPLFLSLFGSS